MSGKLMIFTDRSFEKTSSPIPIFSAIFLWNTLIF